MRDPQQRLIITDMMSSLCPMLAPPWQLVSSQLWLRNRQHQRGLLLLLSVSGQGCRPLPARWSWPYNIPLLSVRVRLSTTHLHAFHHMAPASSERTQSHTIDQQSLMLLPRPMQSRLFKGRFLPPSADIDLSPLLLRDKHPPIAPLSDMATGRRLVRESTPSL